MDRLNQIRGEAERSKDFTLDTSSLPSEAYITANESSSKFFSLSEVDSTFSVSPTKDSNAAPANADTPISNSDLISNLSPIPKPNDLGSFKIGKQIEAANILSGGVNIFDDNSYDGDELVIDDNIQGDDGKSNAEQRPEDVSNVMSIDKGDGVLEATEVAEAIGSKDTEVVLQIDGKNVDAIDIGNDLYLYRKPGEEELAAVQIVDDNQQQPCFKFLKVRENAEGNLEVYEEIEIEVPKELPTKNEDPKGCALKSQVKEDKISIDSENNKISENINKFPQNVIEHNDLELEPIKEESKINFNGKMIKFSESRKSPVISTFTPMTYNSTPNKEGIPLTKIMVDQQLHPNRHSDNIKKTIEVHTESSKNKLVDTPSKNKEQIIDNLSENVENDIKENTSQELPHTPENNLVIVEEKECIDDIIKDNKLEENKIKESVDLDILPDLNVNNEIILKDLTEKNTTDEKCIVKVLTEKTKEDELINDGKIKCDDFILNKILTPNVVSESNIVNESVDLITCDDIETVEDKLVIVEDIASPDINDEKKDDSPNLEKVIEDDKLLVENEQTKLDPINKSEANEKSCTQEDKKQIDDKDHELKEIASIVKPDVEVKNSSHDDVVCNTVNEKNNTVQIKAPLEANESKSRETKEVVQCDAKNTIEDIQCDSKNTIEAKECESKNTAEAVVNKSQNTKEDMDGESKNLTEVIDYESKNTTDVIEDESKDLTKLKEFKSKNATEFKETESNNATEVTEFESKNAIEIIECESKNATEAIRSEPLNTSDEIKVEPNKTSETIECKSKNNTEIVNVAQNKMIEDVSKPCGISKHGQNDEVVSKNPNTLKLESEMKVKDSSAVSLQTVKTQKQEEQTKDHNDALKLKIDLEVNDCNKTQEKQTKCHIPTKEQTVNEQKDHTLIDLTKPDVVLPKENKTLTINEIKTTNQLQKPVQLAVKAYSSSSDIKTDIKKETEKFISAPPKQINKKNCAAVPFGKWTEANRQEFLNKIKETKVTSSNSNTKQLKQPKDLNRRDVLKKIDSQRQTNNIVLNKGQDVNSSNKSKVTTVTFKNKPNIEQIASTPIANFTPKDEANSVKDSPKLQITFNTAQDKLDIIGTVNKKLGQMKAINNQDLIDRTIEGIINRALPAKPQDDNKQAVETNANTKEKNAYPITLDDIEKKMNELHGIPFVERPPHELPATNQESKSNNSDNKTSNASKTDVLLSLTSFTNKPKHNVIKEYERTNISDEEIIEHVPITGDINLPSKSKISKELVDSTICDSGAKKEPIITEKDFDKFARRNSVTYENCLTVNFDRKEPHNVIKSIIPKDVPAKKMSRNELMLAESKAKSVNKQNIARQHHHSSKIPTAAKISNNDNHNKNYQSKVQIAYQSALTAKRQLEGPITIIEDKPVKVVFMDTNSDFVPVLNVQGQELSPSKIQANDTEKFVHSASESLDSDILESYENKLQEDAKSKSKHQRKQVLTPVEAPELELIEPSDLGVETSPKKKRRFDDKNDKKTKTLVPKKSYLLNRDMTEDKQVKGKDTTDVVNRTETFIHSDPISAIDNLVKAAELLETQSENKILNNTDESNSQHSTPVKRGRGRPRKYPLPGSDANVTKSPSPQKKPRLQEERVYKESTETEDSSDDEIIKENWTMGKINENIVCPICSKLFRSENVVFKHVKHCTGPSPNRSDSDKRSSSRLRRSQESKRSSADSKSDDDMDFEEEVTTPRKRRSRDSRTAREKHDDVINKQSEKEKNVATESHKSINKPKFKTNNLVCELCGKSFRQLSYLLSHKLQHKNEEVKTTHNEEVNKDVFSCEVCKKEFRKLHHLVHHRPIHKLNAMSSRLSRKSSSEHRDHKSDRDNKTQAQTKQLEEHGAGFRCEPCDKSFRKLHHLVEHRETHDGINKKCPPQSAVETVKAPTHQCDICKKSFKKLQHLMEHKDQHLETSSEKSDDKSVQSSLSTRDIIHECSLCYMVFPNEHSLNKHTIICARKKKQSAAKPSEDKVSLDDDNKEDIEEEEDVKAVIDPVPVQEIKPNIVHSNEGEEISTPIVNKPPETNTVIDDSDSKSDDIPLIKAKESEKVIKIDKPSNEVETKRLNMNIIETIVIPDTPTPKKRPATKEKIGKTVTKKQKTLNTTMPVIESKSTVESNDDNDDDEVRYMLNPNFKPDDTGEEKFMKVRAKKRSSLQIERPNSKDLVIRRISLQHPPKIPRLKAKPVETKVQAVVKSTKAPNADPVPSTDSDDSDIKYSFPKPAVVKSTPKKVEKTGKKLEEKRKSLSSIAKRKSLGKLNPNAPAKKIRKRIFDVEHRCDCGQLFSSAALLSRHTTLAHTPPRIRRRRSPLPETKPQKPVNQPKLISKQAQPSVTQQKTQPQQQKQKPIAKQKATSTKPNQTSTQHKQNPSQQKQSSTQQKQTTTQQKSTIAQSGSTSRSKSSNVTNASKNSKGVATRKSSVIK